MFALALTLVGIGVALDLVWLHYKVHTDPNYHSFCAMSDSFNCETVAESRYAVFLRLPVAVWGVLGYAALAAVLTLSWSRGLSTLGVVFGLAFSAAATVASVILAVISYCVICAFCVLCTVTYAVNLTLLVLFGRAAFVMRPSLHKTLHELRSAVHSRRACFLAAAVLLAGTFAIYPDYWKQSFIAQTPLRHGVTDEGSHWLGASEPRLTVVEFSDYLCPHCKRGHLAMRDLLSQNPMALRVVHRHFPLDDACNPLVRSPFHPGACLLAQAAYCAGKQGRFWEMNDLLYESGAASSSQERASAAARSLGLNDAAFHECLSSAEAREAVDRDIKRGLELEIRGTPAFVVNERVYPGKIPDSVLEAAGLASAGGGGR